MIREKLRILADENIPALDQLLGDQADIVYVPGRSIQPDQLRHMDCLLVRSVTPVNEALLSGSTIKFVGSCTIGTDHIDLDYLQQQGIHFANAPGCNASAVVDYVLSAMFYYRPVPYWHDKTVGIIGFGQVGSRLHHRLSNLGIKTRCYDPFVDAVSDDFDTILESDCISFHVPLTKSGKHPTYHMVTEKVLARMKKTALLINTARGAVIDNRALKQHLEHHEQAVVLDVFEEEPLASRALLPLLLLATPHIAGYSQQGKIKGSIQVVAALSEYLELPIGTQDILQESTVTIAEIDSPSQLINQVLPLRQQSETFTQGFLSTLNDAAAAAYFDHYRKHYPLRNEWSFTKLACRLPVEQQNFLHALGFAVST